MRLRLIDRLAAAVGLTLVALGGNASAASVTASAQRPDALASRVEAFLHAYAAGNEQDVLSFVTTGQPHIYGSDEAEAVDSREGFAAMLKADHKLWNGIVSFGPMRNVSEERSGNLATIFFDAGFQLGGREVPVRFSMVWRREHGAWKLVQSSNVVPTTGQTATELLNH